jgi:DNA-binding NtrC family response regulator
VRLVIRREFLELSYNVIEARDDVEGEGLVKAVQDVQVLVSDVAMPGGISGTALAGLARRARPEIRVVLISGFIDAEAGEIRCLQDVAFLPKPFDREPLLRAIEGSE